MPSVLRWTKHSPYTGLPQVPRGALRLSIHPSIRPSEPTAAATGLQHVAARGSWLLSGQHLSWHSCWELAALPWKMT